MRISNKQIKKIIQEEIRKVLNEQQCPAGSSPQEFAGGYKCITPDGKVVKDTTKPPSGYGEPAQQAAKAPRRGTGRSQVQDAPDEPVRSASPAFKGVNARIAKITAHCKTAGAGAKVPGKPGIECAEGGNYVKGKYAPRDPQAIARYCKAKGSGAKVPGKPGIECAEGGNYKKVAKEYKYSKKVEIMQKMMSGHPEIGSKLKRIIGTADGQLGPRTQKAVNYLRRYYRKKGAKVARGVGSVIDFLADAKGGADENPEARKAALGFKRGRHGQKWEKHVDNINNMKPENLKKFLTGKPKEYLNKVKTIAKRKGYKGVALVADTLAA